jgi:hypothetical protein
MTLHFYKGYSQVRIWMDEPLPPAFIGDTRWTTTLPAASPASSTPRSAGVEIYFITEPRTVYAAIGGAFTPNPNATQTLVQVEATDTYAGDDHLPWVDALARGLDTVRVGIYREYLRGVEGGLRVASERGLLQAGALRLNRGAQGELGSSVMAFAGATFLLLCVLWKWEHLEIIAEVDLMWQLMVGGDFLRVIGE